MSQGLGDPSIQFLLLALRRKSPTKTPAQFKQQQGLALNFDLKFNLNVANLVHLVSKQTYEKINLVVWCVYKEGVSLKSLLFNIFGKGSIQHFENICHPDLEHLNIFPLQLASCWHFQCCGILFRVEPILASLGYHWICTWATKTIQTGMEHIVH